MTQPAFPAILVIKIPDFKENRPKTQTVMAERNHTICVIDDEPSVVKAVSRIIRLAGFNVNAYASAREMLDNESLESVDLMLLDIKMPIMDGFALQAHLVANGYRMPFVFMTAHDVEMARATAKKRNAAAFLQKPFDERTLIAAIRRGLQIETDGLPID